jgi:hypothetical protein
MCRILVDSRYFFLSVIQCCYNKNPEGIRLGVGVLQALALRFNPEPVKAMLEVPRP